MKISVSMITLNEERNIGRALASCSFADEIVVVDGGSTDRTVEILRSHPRVVLATHPWDGHFGNQRQRCLERCTGDWVIRLDADEAYSDEFERGIRPFLETLGPDVGGCLIRQCNLVGNESWYAKAHDGHEAIPRIWRNRPGVRWERHVHEYLTGIEGRIVPVQVYVVHYGFLDKGRYAEKGAAYSAIPGSGFTSPEELLFREYDFQPRPPSSAVGRGVPPHPAGTGRRSGRTRVAIVRGPYLNPQEMQNYEPLSGVYDLTAYSTTEPAFDVSKVRLPVVKVPPNPDSPGCMEGLEFALFDEDLIYSADTTYLFSCQAAMIREKFGKRLVCLQWENIPFAYEENPVMKRIKAVVRAGADHFIAVTERARDALVLEGVDPGRITVVPMGIDTERFRPDGSLRDSCRAELGISPGELVVLFVGRMKWEKGVYDLVHAAGLAKARLGGAPVRYVMVGKGSEREGVIARAAETGLAESFLFIEGRPYDGMRDLYNAADLFVLPSVSTRTWKEQFGMALVEAMACGTPVVSTTSGSIPEVVGDAGILVPANDPKELAGAVASLCLSGALRSELAGKGRARAVERFDSRVVAKRVGEVFERVLREDAKPAGTASVSGIGSLLAPGVGPRGNRAAGDGDVAPSSAAQAAPAAPEVKPGGMDPEGRSYYRCGRNDVLALIPADASRILDVGCGEGVLGQLLLERGATEVVGIEAEPAAAAAARKRLSRVFPGDVEVMDLPFDDGYFDCIVLADVLEHLRDPLAALKKLKRHLSDSGTVVASMPNVRYLPVVERLAGGRWEYKDSGILDRTHLRFFTRKEMELLFRDAGFEPEGVSENLSPAYDSLPPAHAGELSFGCVTLRGQTSEEIKDLFVFQYLFRARKAGIATRSTIAGAEAALSSGDLEGARAALERRLLESPLDMEALLAHSDVAFRLGMREAALEDLERILLFEPGREDALRRKAAIEGAGLPAK
jgi:glycosyltransferase involved in cell wall biosynthesis/2-polyprenyl-3-methyl-5-hydroxy-6-metoxy-1,4-benzoquinol methylase